MDTEQRLAWAERRYEQAICEFDLAVELLHREAKQSPAYCYDETRTDAAYRMFRGCLLRMQEAERDHQHAFCDHLHATKGVRLEQESQAAKDSAFRRAQSAAHAAVARAVREYALIRPDRCEECGCECTPVAHHDHYGFPLDVRWLCCPCHGTWHAEHGSAPY